MEWLCPSSGMSKFPGRTYWWHYRWTRLQCTVWWSHIGCNRHSVHIHHHCFRVSISSWFHNQWNFRSKCCIVPIDEHRFPRWFVVYSEGFRLHIAFHGQRQCVHTINRLIHCNIRLPCSSSRVVTWWHYAESTRSSPRRMPSKQRWQSRLSSCVVVSCSQLLHWPVVIS